MHPSHDGRARATGRPAAFFDLDKTIIAKSSTLAFSKPFQAGGLISRRAVLRSAYAQFVYLVGGADHDQMEKMREFLSDLCAGWDVQTVRDIVADTLHHIVDPLVYDEAVSLIEEHQLAGRDVVIVSASGAEVVEPIGEMLGADGVVATRMRIEDGRYTGDRDTERHDAEQSHHRFKRAVDQALMLRGSRDFAGMAEYTQFLKGLFAQRNAGRRQRLAEELAVMRELPERRMESAKRERVTVDSGSLIHVDRNAYSVNSRLIGEKVEARVYLDRVEVWYGQKKVEELPRLRGRSKHRVDYRHIIEWLVRKPGAFENYRYKQDLFPTSRFRMAYDGLQETAGERALKEYLKILKLAADEGETAVDEALRALLERKTEVSLTAEAIGALLPRLDTIAPVRLVEVAAVDLASFDQLCTETAVQQ